MEDFQKHLPDGETTQKRLLETLYTTETENRPIPGFDPNIDELEYYKEQHCIDCDDVYPGIYIGNSATAQNKKYLRMIGITHVLNTAEGAGYGFVNTSKTFYMDMPIQYLGFPMADLCSTDISRYFYPAADFIDEALSSGGKVFVHCVMGISRSSTCVLAYLMIKKGMLAVDAIRTVRRNRYIHPNNGFLHQLAQLDNQLRRQRL